MPFSISSFLTKPLAVVHRWLGVALCLPFLLWFLSGIGMMYFPFPEVTPRHRLERSPALAASTIHLSPAEAYATLGLSYLPVVARLDTFDGRPVYRFGADLVYADTGERQLEVTRAMVVRSAEAWTGQPAAAATVEPVEDVDQWTIQGQYPGEAPLLKFSWPNGDQVYVAEASGDVVQYTTRASRIGAYLGPIPHWLYFTPLRRHGAEWAATVIWSSGLGVMAAVLGLAIGLLKYSPSRRYRHDGGPTRLPYRGQKRWHMALGLTFGAGAVTWAFSGLLSMDPFPSHPPPTAGDRVPDVLLDAPRLEDFDARHPREALALLEGLDVRELELATFAGEPVYLARLAGGATRIVPVAGEPSIEVDRRQLLDIVRRAAEPARVADVRVLERYDRYYLDRRRGLPLPVLLVRLDDEASSRLYVDPATAAVTGRYHSGQWTTRWLYHGLHSLNFPWLYNHRPAWDIVVIALMLGGAALSVTSIALVWRLLRHTAVRGRDGSSGA